MDADPAGPTATASTQQPRRGRRRRVWVGVLASYLVMVFALVNLNFLLPRVMPGDPLDGLMAQAPDTFNGGEATMQAVREYYHLDGSLWSQYTHYISGLAHGDFGRSITSGQSVNKEIQRRLPWTLLLMVTSVLLAAVIGVVAGVHSGWRRDRPADRAMMTGLLAIWQFPPYLLASLLLFLFAVKLGWFPVGGETTRFGTFGPLERALDIGWHLVLPLTVLTATLAAENYLVMRAGMVRELGADYLLLGRAKGLPDRRLKYGYAARNAVLPLVALTAVDVGFAVGANVIVERVFSYQGLGQFMFEAIGSHDYPAVQGVFLLLALIVVTANALADVLYRRLDPRTAL